MVLRTSTAEWRTCCSQDERETVLRALEESRSGPHNLPLLSLRYAPKLCVKLHVRKSAIQLGEMHILCFLVRVVASVQGGLTQIFSHDRSTWVAPRFPSGYLVVEVDRRCVLNCTATNDPAPKIQSCSAGSTSGHRIQMPEFHGIFHCHVGLGWFRRGHDGMICDIFFSLLFSVFPPYFLG